jgi:hypothetical protein
LIVIPDRQAAAVGVSVAVVSSNIDSEPASWKQYSPLIVAASLVAGGVAAKYLIDDRKRRKATTFDDLFVEENLDDLFHDPNDDDWDNDSTDFDSPATLTHDSYPLDFDDERPVPMISDTQLDHLCEALFNDQASTGELPPKEVSSVPTSSGGTATATRAQRPKPLESSPIEPPSPPGKRGSFMSWIVLLSFLALAGFSASFYNPWSSPKRGGQRSHPS